MCVAILGSVSDVFEACRAAALGIAATTHGRALCPSEVRTSELTLLPGEPGARCSPARPP